MSRPTWAGPGLVETQGLKLYNKTMNNNYDDIIDIDYENVKSKRHPRMSKLARAAQFAPFAALTGHEEAIKDTADAHKPDEIVRDVFYDEG